MTPARIKFYLSCIIILAVAARIAAGFILGPHRVWEYEEIAFNILQGEGFKCPFLETQHFATTEPLYPILTALVYALFGVNHFAVMVMQSFFSILLILVLYEIGKTIFSPQAGLLASFIVSVHPAFVYYDVKNLHPLSLGAAFIALSAWTIIKFSRRPSFKSASLAGAASGIGALARGTVGSFFLISCVWSYFLLRKNKNIMKFLLVMLISFAAVVSFWTVRNYIRFKKIVPIRSTVSLAFWYGNNQNASGTSFTKDGTGMDKLIPEELKKRVNNADEFEQNRIFKNEALNFIRNNPKRFLELTLKKSFYFWWFAPQAGLMYYPESYRAVYKAFYLVFLALFLTGFYFSLFGKNKELRQYAFLFLMLFISVALVHTLTYVDCRHRWGIEPLMALFSGFSILKIWEFFKNKGARDEIYR